MSKKSEIQLIKDRREEFKLILDIMDTIEKHPKIKTKTILLVLNELNRNIINKIYEKI